MDVLNRPQRVTDDENKAIGLVPGDTVQLKSGGPRMVVISTKLPFAGPDRVSTSLAQVEVEWMSEIGERHTGWFLCTSLKYPKTTR